MRTREQAEDIAARVLGRAPDGTERDWDLVEFGSSWLIRPTVSHCGAACMVVERGSGRVLRFPSYVRAGRILEEYGEVVAEASTVRDGGDFPQA